jgi:hypothetical protein
MLAGCTAHISKPVKKVLLLETIRDMTESSSHDFFPEQVGCRRKMLQPETQPMYPRRIAGSD